MSTLVTLNHGLMVNRNWTTLRTPSSGREQTQHERRRYPIHFTVVAEEELYTWLCSKMHQMAQHKRADRCGLVVVREGQD